MKNLAIRTAAAVALVGALVIAGTLTARAACVTSAGTWTNAALAPQSGAFTATFDATPSAAKMDGVSGLSNGAASGYASLATAVRFNNLGFIDARNGGAYAAAASIPYTAGKSYHFRLAVDVPSHRYSAYVTPAGGAEVLIGANYSFRTEQLSATALSNAGLLASTGGETACSIAASGSAAPSDTTPPSVALSAPLSGAAVSGTVSVTASASDNVGVAGVQFKLDGVNLGAEDTAAPFAASWNTAQTADGAHVLTAVARDAAGNATTSAGVSVKVSNASPAPGAACVTSAGSWTNSAFPAQTGSFTSEFDATPAMAKMDGVTGLSNGAASGYAALAAAVRFNNLGFIDARNGGAYAAAASIPYNAGTSYHFRLVVNVPSHVYSAYVKPAGGTEVLIGGNYSFRTEQLSASSLSSAGLLASTGGETACSIAAAAAPAASDTTPPSVALSAPLSGAAVSGTVSVTANASDNVGVAGVQFKLDGANLGAEDTSAPFAASWNSAQAADGAHVLTAVARDAAGNVKTSAGVTVNVSNAVAVTGFSDSFSGYTKNVCFPDGTAFGPWRASYAGYGCVQTGTDGTTSWLDEAPKASVTPSETHASLAVGPVFSGPLTYTINMETVAQLRTGSAPNPWEVAWAIWNYTDDTHFYYFQAKPNGWELGKEDPAYTGAQRFLATGPSPVFPIGKYYNVKIVQASNVITVYVDGQLITSFTDNERPYTSGRIGFYNEDSHVRAKDVSVSVPPSAASNTPPANGGVAANLVRAQQTFLSPRLADGINDAAVFGPEAREVSVFSARGRRVFHESRSGAAPIVWRGTDGTGLADSGVYVARLKASDQSVLYQSFAVVK